jgi:hypothetical protein
MIVRNREIERPTMTREEAQAFRDRWRIASAFTDKELRNAPVGRRLQQLSALYNFALSMRWLDRLGKDEKEVWIRWQELRTRYADSVPTSQSHS